MDLLLIFMAGITFVKLYIFSDWNFKSLLEKFGQDAERPAVRPSVALQTERKKFYVNYRIK